MMKVGNERYRKDEDIKDVVKVLNIKGEIMMNGGKIKINILEKSYMQMVENEMDGKRIIGMIKKKIDREKDDKEENVDEMDERMRKEISKVG